MGGVFRVRPFLRTQIRRPVPIAIFSAAAAAEPEVEVMWGAVFIA